MTFYLFCIINNKKGEKMIYLTVILGIIADQITKLWALAALSMHESVPVMPGVNWFLTYNKGVSFSLFSNDGAYTPYYLSILSLLIVFGILYWMKSEENTTIKWALSLIISGAIGNVIDRLRLGHVIDFIDVYYKSYHWPAFNIADSLICLGASILILHTLFFNHGRKK